MEEQLDEIPTSLVETHDQIKSKEDLEKEKLILEINNLKLPFFAKLTFWPPFLSFLVVGLTYYILWKNGTFQYKQDHLTYITDTLTAYKKRLDTSIHNLIADSVFLRKRLDEYQFQIDSMKNVVQETKLKYAVHIKGEITKRQLTSEVAQFNKTLVNFINSCDRKSRELSERYWHAAISSKSPQEHKEVSNNWDDERTKLDNEFMQDFRLNYQKKASFLKNELIKYVPLDKNRRNINQAEYDHPVNMFVIEDIEIELGELNEKLKSAL